MRITPDQITIAITAFVRREFLRKSIGSALEQTVPVRVMVSENCGPDRGLEVYVREQFGSRVEYFRNPRNRGIFGNMNACIERCPTPWLSILHDDDYLLPGFVASMLTLAQDAGERALYFGQAIVVNDQGEPLPLWEKPPLPASWLPVELKDILFTPPFSFPGQLFRVDCARALGGFRETSLFCGDWELWARMIALEGAAQSAATTAVFRDHGSWDRGSNRVFRSGKTHGLINVQRKRNLALARGMGLAMHFDRREHLARAPMSILHLIQNAAGFSPRLLAYNVGLVQRSTPPHWRYRAFQLLTRFCGPRMVGWLSFLWNRYRRGIHGNPGGRTA